MNRFPLRLKPELLRDSAYAVLIVMATTFFLLLAGRRELGEAVIALVYLVPIIWSGYRWGEGPGMSAALAAALAFDFLFIPPFYTFAIGSLEGWLVLGIFLAVAMLLVGRFHASLTKAREAVFMYELSEALSNMLTWDAVTHTLGRYVQQLYQASLVSVSYQPTGQSSWVVVSEPQNGKGEGKPDCLLPILNAWGLVGEIQIWRGDYLELPAEDSPLLQNFAAQTARALERARLVESRLASSTNAKESITNRG
jgi:K+-sensing histidine kinase KdpD